MRKVSKQFYVHIMQNLHKQRAKNWENQHNIPDFSNLFVCLVGFLTPSSTTRLYRGRAPRLTILGAAKHETEWGDHDFCLSLSHYMYTDTDPTSRERAATATS